MEWHAQARRDIDALAGGTVLATRAHLKAETSGSRLNVPRRLAVEWPRCPFSKGMPKWVAKSTSTFVERSEEDDCGGK